MNRYTGDEPSTSQKCRAKFIKNKVLKQHVKIDFVKKQRNREETWNTIWEHIAQKSHALATSVKQD